ncbi:MFS transporter [Aliamphritea hakodatensis]|uniref:MFS transporter n=1 Tax=Aliamphritea hakodatensis TaxID=2895352 RepID=UPI0022FDA5E8|nr:MFS transporter [Aliamphritea hakodatensis]
MNFPVVFFGFVLTLSSSFGQTHFISLFNASWRAEFGLSHGEIGALYSAATLCSAACLIYLGKLIDSIDLRLYTGVVMLGLGGAAWLMTGADSLLLLGISFFLLRLTGQGLSGHVGLTTVSRYAENRRGMSLSICGLGFSLGESVMPAAVAMLLGWLSWRQIWQGVALAEVLVALILAMWLLQRFYPVKEAGSGGSKGSGADSGWQRGQVLRDRGFWLMAPAMFAPSMFITAFFFHQQSLAEYKGIDFPFWAATIVGYSVSSFALSLAGGAAVDRWGAKRIVSFMLLPLLASCWIAGSDLPWVSLLFFALMGAAQGLYVPASGVLWVELYGTRHIGAIRALIHACMVFSSALGPVSFGLLLDAGVGWSGLLWLSMIWIVMASLMLLAGLKKAGMPAVKAPVPQI